MLPEIVTSIPGPRSLELASLLSKYENRNVTYLGPDFRFFGREASGANVWDVDENRFLDLTAGFAVVAHGHTHPSIRAATGRSICQIAACNGRRASRREQGRSSAGS